MQKIFFVEGDSYPSSKCEDINKFIGKKGKIVLISPNTISAGGSASSHYEGSWLVVAEDGIDHNTDPLGD